ncbi:alpha/beta hydrolase [Polyangium sp. y55x31]|uniref:alpha/beta hydrolase n=1 Tax=Polyangium sp. y55x31 TaxID=3042688 RepID=UPI0024832A18|nr:alpha/beta hydrolase [Polyangium sp. y55x31]MDI1482313.1 alpha/beta fold hydrolase [Polyangium sp. y55x31]
MKSVALWSSLLSTVTLLFALPASADPPGEQVLSLPVELSPGVTADIAAQVLVNPDHPNGGRTFVMLHGLAHTGNTFRPLADAVFADNKLDARRVVLLDLPGHGESPLPQGILFGLLSLGDDVAALTGALDALGPLGLHADVLVGHSLGGEIIELTQNELITEGTSLRARFAVNDVVLLAPAIPSPLPWSLADSGAGAAALAPFVVLGDPLLGPHLFIPAPAWQGLFFTNSKDKLVQGPPSVAEIVAQGYIAPEALVASQELLGVGTVRPTVSAGIFDPSHGSDACVVAFSEDLFLPAGEERPHYRYLTGDTQDERFVVVTRFGAVHDMLISDPDAVANAMRTCSK